jgi:hypothetical protein
LDAWSSPNVSNRIPETSNGKRAAGDISGVGVGGSGVGVGINENTGRNVTLADGIAKTYVDNEETVAPFSSDHPMNWYPALAVADTVTESPGL